jgi:hypothetical protein
MTVTVDDLMNQLAEDESRQPQLQFYFDSAQNFVTNAISSDTADGAFFALDNVSPLIDIAVLSHAMEMWTHRSDTLPPSTVVDQLIGQCRGLYDSWKEAQDAAQLQTQ